MNTIARPAQKMIIVVEDDQRIRLDAVTTFEHAGFDVVAFDNVDDAAGYLCDHPDTVGAIFFDIMLSGDLDGIGLAEIASSVAPEVTLVATSGHHDISPTSLPKDVTFLKKPWAPHAIVDAVLRVPIVASDK